MLFPTAVMAPWNDEADAGHHLISHPRQSSLHPPNTAELTLCFPVHVYNVPGNKTPTSTQGPALDGQSLTQKHCFLFPAWHVSMTGHFFFFGEF